MNAPPPLLRACRRSGAPHSQALSPPPLRQENVALAVESRSDLSAVELGVGHGNSANGSPISEAVAANPQGFSLCEPKRSAVRQPRELYQSAWREPLRTFCKRRYPGIEKPKCVAVMRPRAPAFAVQKSLLCRILDDSRDDYSDGKFETKIVRSIADLFCSGAGPAPLVSPG